MSLYDYGLIDDGPVFAARGVRRGEDDSGKQVRHERQAAGVQGERREGASVASGC